MKRLFFIFLFSIINIYPSKNNKIILHNEGLFSFLPKELKLKILNNLPVRACVTCGSINKDFSNLVEGIVERGWHWQEQIPKIFYEKFYTISRRVLEVRDKKKGAAILERSRLPRFIKPLVRSYFKDSIPYFCFHGLFNFNFDQRKYCNITFKNTSEWEYTLEWDTNFKDTSLRNKLKLQYNYYINKEGIKVIDDDTESIEENFYITESNPNKGTILILNISCPDNAEAVLKKLLEEKITKKIYILQIETEIDENIFLILSPLLKKLGENLILSVAPLTRFLCIQDNINIVLPKKYYHKEAKYKELIKKLFNLKKKHYPACSVWSKENISNKLSLSFKKFCELKPWMQLTSILGMDYAKVITALVPNSWSHIFYEYENLFNAYGTKKFTVPSVQVFVELLLSTGFMHILPKQHLFGFHEYVKKISVKNAYDKILVPATLFLLNSDNIKDGIEVIKLIKSPSILKDILPKVLKICDQFPEKFNALFYSNFCIHLYELAGEILIDDFIKSKNHDYKKHSYFDNFIKFQERLIDTLPWGNKKKLCNQVLATCFENTFLAAMSKEPVHTLINHLWTHKEIFTIYDYLRNSDLIITPEKSIQWLHFIDTIAQHKTFFSDREFILSYIDNYINLQIKPSNSINDIINAIHVEITSGNYSKKLQEIIYFTLCKNKKKYKLSDDFFKEIITKTGMFSIDLLADWIHKFVTGKGNKAYNISIIKMLINSAKNINEAMVSDISYKNHNRLFLVYIDAYLNSDFLEHFSREERAFIQEMIYDQNTYIDKILEFYKKNGSNNRLSDLTFIISYMCTWTINPIEQVMEELSKYCINVLEKTYNYFEIYKLIQHLSSIQNQKRYQKTLELLKKCLEKYCAHQDYWLCNSVYIINPYVIELINMFSENKKHMKIIENTIEKISEKNYVKNFIEHVPNLKPHALSICKNLCKMSKEYPLFKPLSMAFCQELTGLQNIISLYNFTDDREVRNICKSKLSKISIFSGGSLVLILIFYMANKKYHFFKKRKFFMLFNIPKWFYR